jgi:hypothetical protein
VCLKICLLIVLFLGACFLALQELGLQDNRKLFFNPAEVKVGGVVL